MTGVKSKTASSALLILLFFFLLPAIQIEAGTITGRVLQAADSDGDGIPDYWEVIYGLDINDPSDASVDNDGDGLTNLEEFQQNTAPGGQADLVPSLSLGSLTLVLLLLSLFLYRRKRVFPFTLAVSLAIGVFIFDIHEASSVGNYRTVEGAVVTSLAFGTSTTTDSSGNFTITGVSGTQKILAQFTNGDMAITEVTVSEGGRGTTQDLILTKSGGISVSVTLSGQSDHSGVNVYVTGTTFHTTSNTSGTVVLNNVPAGTHKLAFEKQGFVPQIVENVNVTSSTTTILDPVTLSVATSTGTVTGRAFLLNESNHSGIAISVGRSIAGTTSLDGTYTVTGVPPGIYFVHASKDAFKTRISNDPVTVTARSERVTVPDMTLEASTGPTTVDFNINFGANKTKTRSVHLISAVAGAKQMIFSESSTFLNADWTNFSSEQSFTLSEGDGDKTVFVQYRDSAALTSGQRSDTITLDAVREWEPVGKVGFTKSTATIIKLDFHPTSNEPYVAFRDGSQANLATVMYYDVNNDDDANGGTDQSGVNWKIVGQAGFSPFTVDSTWLDLAFNPETNEPYIAIGNNSSELESVVMKFSNGSWDSVGSLDFCSCNTTFPSLAFHPDTNELYLGFSGNNFSYSTIYYDVDNNDDANNGADTSGVKWKAVGSLHFTSGSVFTSSLAFNPSTKLPYVAFRDNDAATVMRYTGSAWENVGSPRFKNIRGIAPIAFNPSTNEPYVGVNDADNFNRATVMKFDGSSWQPVGSEGFTSGSIGLSFPSLSFNPTTNEPYFAFTDGGNGEKTTVAYYDENNDDDANGGLDTSGAKWKAVGNVGFGDGVQGLFPSLVFNPFTKEPYVAFVDVSVVIDQLGTKATKGTVMKY